MNFAGPWLSVAMPLYLLYNIELQLLCILIVTLLMCLLSHSKLAWRRILSVTLLLCLVLNIEIQWLCIVSVTMLLCLLYKYWYPKAVLSFIQNYCNQTISHTIYWLRKQNIYFAQNIYYKLVWHMAGFLSYCTLNNSYCIYFLYVTMDCGSCM